MKNLKHYQFFLGGYDLEMQVIKDLLEEHCSGQISDGALSWGAKASDYAKEIQQSLNAGKTPVLIELLLDMNLDWQQCIIIDHHGDKSGKHQATSLEQIFSLLQLPDEKWTRYCDLVAANDRGHIQGMQAINASMDEIIRIRTADRNAQGVTKGEEATAEISINHRKYLADHRLTLVEMNHNHCSAVVDRMEKALGGPGYENLLIISPDEINFYGRGCLVKALNEQFSNGWYGGDLPERGFWGISNASFKNQIIAFLENKIPGN